MESVRHAGIVTSDLESSLRFYKDLLGLRLTVKTEEPGEFIDNVCGLKSAKLTTVKLAADDGSLVELLCFHSHPSEGAVKGICDPGISHIAFTVKDLDEEYKKLVANGVSFISRPEISPNGYAKVAFCTDPNGVFVELVEVMEAK